MTSRDDCDHIQRLISDGLDRPLTASETTTVRAHIAGCDACAAFERALRAGTTGIAALPRVPASPRIRMAIMDEIERGSFGRPRGARGWLRQGLQIAGSGAAFALVALLLITVIGSGAGRGEERGPGGVGASADASPTAESVPMVPSAATPTAGTPPPDCVPGQYELAPDALEASLDDGTAIIITVGAIKSSGGAFCRLAEDVTVTLVDTAGTPLAVEGNPLMRAIDATVPSDEAGFALAWLNWCGDAGEVSLRIEGASSASEQGPLPLPTCDDASQPSKLGDAAAADIAAIDPLPAGPDCMMTGGPEQLDGDVVRIMMGVSTDPACLDPDGTVTFSLLDGQGELLPVDGNPLSLVPQPLTGKEGIGVVGVEWTSWCGTAEGLMAQVAYPSGGGGASLQATPPCIAGQTSRLTALANPADFFTMPDIGVPLEKAAPMPEPLPPCDLGSVELGIAVERADAAVLIPVKASDANGACSIPPGLTIVLADASGSPLAIDPNPMTAPLPVAVTPDADSIGGAIWHNWCGDDGPFTVTASLGEATASTPIDELPSCHDASEPSTLSTIYAASGTSEREVTVEATATE